MLKKFHLERKKERKKERKRKRAVLFCNVIVMYLYNGDLVYKKKQGANRYAYKKENKQTRNGVEKKGGGE